MNWRQKMVDERGGRLLEAQVQRYRDALPPGAPAPALYPRSWKEATGAPEGRGVPLTVMQFNVLADGLSGKNQELGGFTSPPGSLEFKYRSVRIMEELLRHGVWPDVVMMEEVDHYYDWFQPEMARLGFDGLFLEKPNSVCKSSLDPSLSDGCALFWRREKVSLAGSEKVVFSGAKANQVAIIARLTVGGVQVAAAVTHLKAPKTAEAEQARQDQMGQLLDRLPTDVPCIVGLDMNATPEQGPTTPYPSLAYAVAIGHEQRLHSAYAELLGREPAYTTWKIRAASEARGTPAGEVSHTIDYLLCSEAIRTRRVLLPPEQLDADRLPSWRYPSDHILLAAELLLPPASVL